MKGGNIMAKLASNSRAEKSKQSELKELRNTGKVPAVVYGFWNRKYIIIGRRETNSLK